MRFRNTTMRITRVRTAIALSVAAAMALVSLAACSSSSDRGSGSNQSDAKVSAALNKAATTIAEYGKRPTAIPVSEPISKPIPEGKKLAFVSCGAAACIQQGKIVKEAADILGWTVTVINTNGSSESYKSAWSQVVRLKPDGVIYAAQDKSIFKVELSQLEAGGVPVAACCITDPVGDGITFAIDTNKDAGTQGDVQAAWVTTQSKGSGHALLVNVPQFKFINLIGEGYKKSIKKYCPGCKTDTQEVAVSQLSTAPNKIVSYLRSHPDIKYVVLTLDDLAVGLPAALQAAGLNDVKFIGQGPGPTNFQYIATGKQAASISFPYYEMMWSAVDSIARSIVGDPVKNNLKPKFWLLTEDNLPSATKVFPMVEDYESQFKKIWGKS